MKHEIKKLWVEALRSGQYKQGQGALHVIDRDDPHHYCCLGVLTDLSKLGTWTAPESGICEYHIPDAAEPYNSFLPLQVMKWAGLSDHNPLVASSPNRRLSLAELNDEGKSFTEITDIIEKSL